MAPLPSSKSSTPAKGRPLPLLLHAPDRLSPVGKRTGKEGQEEKGVKILTQKELKELKKNSCVISTNKNKNKENICLKSARSLGCSPLEPKKPLTPRHSLCSQGSQASPDRPGGPTPNRARGGPARVREMLEDSPARVREITEDSPARVREEMVRLGKQLGSLEGRLSSLEPFNHDSEVVQESRDIRSQREKDEEGGEELRPASGLSRYVDIPFLGSLVHPSQQFRRGALLPAGPLLPVLLAPVQPRDNHRG